MPHLQLTTGDEKKLTDYLIPVLTALILGYGFCRSTDVFGAFTDGAKRGLTVALSIFPSLLAMLTAVNMLRASGAVDWLVSVLRPLAQLVGLPAECTPLALLKPVSGSGALAIGKEVMESAGVDTMAGRTAAVMLASADTTFFVISVYFGSLGIRKTRHALPSALMADLAAFLMAAWTVRFFWGG